MVRPTASTGAAAPDAFAAGLERLAAGGVLLFDERSDPPLRSYFGYLLAHAVEADFAVARIRLAGIDLTGSELSGVSRCRLLLGRLDVETLADAGQDVYSNPERRERIEGLLRFVGSGRIRIHAAGIQEWSPDFSVLRRVSRESVYAPGASGGAVSTAGADADGAVVVLGPHHFARTHPLSGPAMTALIPGLEAARLAGRRFDEMFARGYDVTGVVLELLSDLLRGRGR